MTTPKELAQSCGSAAEFEVEFRKNFPQLEDSDAKFYFEYLKEGKGLGLKLGGATVFLNYCYHNSGAWFDLYENLYVRKGRFPFDEDGFSQRWFAAVFSAVRINSGLAEIDLMKRFEIVSQHMKRGKIISDENSPQDIKDSNLICVDYSELKFLVVKNSPELEAFNKLCVEKNKTGKSFRSFSGYVGPVKCAQEFFVKAAKEIGDEDLCRRLEEFIPKWVDGRVEAGKRRQEEKKENNRLAEAFDAEVVELLVEKYGFNSDEEEAVGKMLISLSKSIKSEAMIRKRV